MKQIWVPAIYINKFGNIIDFSGVYEVSNYGNVRHTVSYHCRKQRNITIHKYLQTKYKCVHLSLNGNDNNYLLHRLVLSSFNPDGWFYGAVCNHKDENTENNILSNLEWLSNKDNLNYGERNRKASESLYQAGKSIPIIQDNTKEWLSAKEAERATGINAGNITKCCMGKRKSAGGSTWKYKLMKNIWSQT